MLKNVLTWITVAYAIAWGIVAAKAPDLWSVAALGFVQNIAFTFVSRGRNSGSLGYHLFASIFSNGIYAALLFTSIDQVTQAKNSPATFLAVYTLATMSGSIFAHWLALKIEKGKGKSVQHDKFAELKQRVDYLWDCQGDYNQCDFAEIIIEATTDQGVQIRLWGDAEDEQSIALKFAGLLKDPTFHDMPVSEMAETTCRLTEANACQIQLASTQKIKIGRVFYRDWP